MSKGCFLSLIFYSVFLTQFFIIDAEKKWENFKNSKNDQQVKTLVLTVATRNLYAKSMVENNVIIRNYYLLLKITLLMSTYVTLIKRLKAIATLRKKFPLSLCFKPGGSVGF